MRIECPECGAAYEVPEHLLTRPDGTPARPVRCLRCDHEWQPSARDAAPVARPGAARAPARSAIPLPAIPARYAAPSVLQPSRPPPLITAPQRNSRVAPLLAWALSLLLLAGLAVLLVQKRDAVMSAWPPATHLFTALGLH
jgi:predicted Zn finger-like uncharacterized protein